jgi:hypothetical protein
MLYWVLGGLFGVAVFTICGIVAVDRFIRPTLKARRSKSERVGQANE